MEKNWAWPFNQLVIYSKNPPVQFSLVGKGELLRMQGVGFKSFFDQNRAAFQLGYSHYLICLVPVNSVFRPLKQQIVVRGYGCDLVSRVCNLRRPDPYKGRGIYLVSTKPKLKEGKRR